jgi:predicted nucleic acid-binding Zn ribbon protein
MAPAAGDGVHRGAARHGGSRPRPPEWTRCFGPGGAIDGQWTKLREAPWTSSYDRWMEPVQSFTAGVVAEVIRRQPPSPARTNFVWTVAAGPAMARAATVDARDGLLLVTPKDGRWAREIERARDTLLHRVRQLLGADAVTAIKICEKQ